MMDFEQLSLTKNDTLIDQISSGGVEITLIINTIITIITIIAYLFCLQPFVLMFQCNKKRKMLHEILNKEALKRGEIFDPEEIEDYTDQDDETAGKRWTTRFVEAVKLRYSFVSHIVQTLLIPSVRDEDLNTITKMYGRDLSTYLFFQQQIICALTICTFIGAGILLPLHITGKIPENSDHHLNNYTSIVPNTALLVTSINMRITEPYVLYTHVGLSIMFILVFCFFLIYKFMKRPLVNELNYLSADDEKFAHTKLSEYHLVKMLDYNAARPLRLRMTQMGMSVARDEQEYNEQTENVYLSSPFCVSIKGLPTLLTQPAFLDLVDEAAKEINLDHYIVKAVLIPNLKKRITMQETLYLMYEKLSAAKHELQETGKRPKTTIWFKHDPYDDQFHLHKSFDSIKYFERHITMLESDIKRWDQVYTESFRMSAKHTKNTSRIVEVADEQFRYKKSHSKIRPPKSTGFGVIVFSTEKAAKRFVKHYQHSGIQIKQKSKTRLEKPSKLTTTTYSAISSTPIEEDDRSTLLVETKDGRSYITTQTEEKSIVEKTIEYELVQKKSFFKELVRLDIFSLFSLRVEQVNFEPQDLEWYSVFQFGKHGFKNYLYRAAMFILLLLIFVFLTSPLAVASGVQQFLELNVIGKPVEKVLTYTGNLGSFVFHYVPTFLVLITTIIIPNTIYYSAIWSKHLTHSGIQRRIVERSYTYLVLSTLILPSLLLTSMREAIDYISGKKELTEAFKLLFLPASGSFFINLLLQKGLLKNSFDLSRIWTLIPHYAWSMRFSQTIWKYIGYARYLIPIQKFKIAEQSALYLEYEYAFLHWVLSIALTYSIFSPLVLPCALLYFLYKYFVDRVVIYDTYSHRKSISFCGAAFGFKSDFLSHQKLIRLNMKLVLANMLIFAAFEAMFFGAKISSDSRFVPHTIISATLSFLTLMSIVAIHFILKRKMKKSREGNYKSGDYKTFKLSPSAASKWFEPSTTFHFIPPTKQMDDPTPVQV